MKILIINGSPKKKGGASAFFGGVLRCMLFPHTVIRESAGVPGNYETLLARLETVDAVVISVPLYVDSIPSHVITLLRRMERHCADSRCRFTLYVISNSGFVGGRQNLAHLEQYQCWCERARIAWGGGLGIGGAVMLHVIFYMMLLAGVFEFALRITINLALEKPALGGGAVPGFARSMIMWLFFSGGMLLYEWMLSRAIRRKRRVRNKYTSVMLPSFLFMIVADVFMALSALLHGKAVFSLFKNVKHEAV